MNYESTKDDQHTTMLAIGILACTLPLVFLAASSRAAYVFPTELKNGSPRFLTGAQLELSSIGTKNPSPLCPQGSN
eukprot:5498435-Amphidinium_carterae.1